MRETCNDNFGRAGLALYRSRRYDESVATNPNFYFGPKALLLYGAASFLYELFPSLGSDGAPDVPTISSFFGAEEDGSGGYAYVPERIPPGWRNRRAPFSLLEVASEILAQYLASPKLFGGNVGTNNFDALGGFGAIKDGKLPDETTVAEVACLSIQLATENVPSSVGKVLELPLTLLSFAVGKLNPIFGNLKCPLKIV